MPRIKIGVVGCGLIAQMMHLPHLRELADSYRSRRALCDVSPATLKYVGDHHGIRRRHADYRDLLKEDIEAVAVLSADSHGQVIVDALRAGKHVFTEKPMCYTLREADAIIDTQTRAGTVCLVAYMKRYDPAVRYAAPLIQRLPDLQAIQITVLHPSEANQIGHHDLRRFADVPDEAAARLRGEQDRLIREAIGDFTSLERRVFAGNLLSRWSTTSACCGVVGRSVGGALHRRVGGGRQSDDVSPVPLGRARHDQPPLPARPRALRGVGAVPRAG